MAKELKQLSDQDIEYGKRLRTSYENSEEGEIILAIPKINGGEIEVSLLKNAKSTEEQQDDFQLNTLMRIRPLAEIKPKNFFNPIDVAMLREGYLYIFFKGRLWRELKVDDQGLMSDVDLERYREDDLPNDRANEGIWQNAILVPSLLQGKFVMEDISIAFSEIAWSWPYILWLENNPLEIKKRAQNIVHSFASELNVVFPKHDAAANDALKFSNGSPAEDVSTLSPMRAREPSVELMLENPAQEFTVYFKNPKKDSLSNKIKAKWDFISEQEKIKKEKEEKKKEAKEFIVKYGQQLLEDISSRLTSQDTTNNNVGSQLSKSDENNQKGITQATKNSEAHDNLFTKLSKMIDLTVTPADDTLIDLRNEEHVVAVSVADPLFTLRHALTQIRLSVDYLESIEGSLKYTPLAYSATMINKLLFHSSIDLENNDHKDEIIKLRKAVDKTKLDETLSIQEQKNTIRHIKKQIKTIEHLLSSEHLVSNLRDYASHHALGVAEALLVTASLVNTVGRVMDVTAKYGLSNDLGAADLLKNLLENQSLIEFCNPTEDDIPMDQDLPPLGEIEVNDGSGKYRPNFIRSMVENEQEIDKKSLNEIHLEALANLVKQALESNASEGADSVLRVQSISNLIATALGGWSTALLMNVQKLVEQDLVIEVKVNSLYAAAGANLKLGSKGFSGLRLLARNSVDLEMFTIIGVHGDGLDFGMTESEKVSITNKLDHKKGYYVADITSNSNSSDTVATTSKKTQPANQTTLQFQKFLAILWSTWYPKAIN